MIVHVDDNFCKQCAPNLKYPYENPCGLEHCLNPKENLLCKDDHCRIKCMTCPHSLIDNEDDDI